MQTSQNKLEDSTIEDKKPYHCPHLTKHGDFRGITLSDSPDNPTSYDAGSGYTNSTTVS